MILGIGNDLVDIRRIEQAIARYGERFLDRLFTPVERERAERRRPAGAAAVAAVYAKRFAAKEACAKALGTGFREGVFWRDLGVINSADGRPTLQLTGGAGRRLATLTPPGLDAVVHLTLTDEPPMAQAVVVIEAVSACSAAPPAASASASPPGSASASAPLPKRLP